MRLLAAVALLTVTTLGLAAEPEYPKQGPDLYDTQADGTAQIAAALVEAKAAHKHVLLKLGANWCIWCRRLSEAFHRHETVARELKDNYIVVLIDMNQREGKKRNVAVNERYGNPIQHGYPVLLVLDAEGKLLTTQETGALEDGGKGHDPEKILAFLRRWAPAR